MTEVGFVGAGQMGLPMVQRLLGAGHDVTVWARRPEVRETCAGLGATAVADGAAAVRDRPIVLVCLFSDAQVEEVLLGPGGLLDAADPSTLFVLHTTGSPALVRRIAERGGPREVRVVDAPVSGTAEDILAGRLTVMVGGDEADVEAAVEVVAAYGDAILRTGTLGSAQMVKLVNNALFTAQLQLVGQAERILVAVRADVGVAARAIQRSSGASYAMGIVEQHGTAVATAEMASGFLHKDVSVIQEVASEMGIDLGVLSDTIEGGPFTFRPREGA